jgi:sugar O-acyltransferase (sialic acid O-acetyltransferase NeuD family)
VSNKPKKLLILGTRTFAVEIADIVSEIKGLELVGFVENMNRQCCEERLEEKPIYWVDDISDLAKNHYAVCALSTTYRKRFVEQAAAYNIKFTSVIHPTARISSKSSLKDGSIINSGVIIASHTKLGEHAVVNRGALIGHHTRIGDYVSIQPGANIAGACIIGNSTYIGMGAIVLDHINIGSHSVIGAGAVVTRDVPDNVQVVGIPAKIVKENISGK